MSDVTTTAALTDRTEKRRVARSDVLTDSARSALGQYFTPEAAARFIASLPTLPGHGELRVLLS
jgi:hypothetical protein